MYTHAIATLALVEVGGLRGGTERHLEAAKKAAAFLGEARNPGTGWRYTSRPRDNDTSVTMWATLAARMAWHAGIDVKDEVFEDAKAWFDEATELNYYRVGYTHRGTGKVFMPGKNDMFNHHETLTAGAAFCRILLGVDRGDAALHGAIQLIVRDLPKWDGNDIDFYYWHFGTLAAFHYDGPDGKYWKTWNEKMQEVLVKNQRAGAGCAPGSWDPVDRWSFEGGRVYSTAINALTLETYYRYRRPK